MLMPPGIQLSEVIAETGFEPASPARVGAAIRSDVEVAGGDNVADLGGRRPEG
jgi:hypothetical protein